MYKLKANESRSGTLTGGGTLPMGMGTIGENGQYGFTKDTVGQSIGVDIRGYFIAATDPILPYIDRASNKSNISRFYSRF